jgi:hypothetical protein
MAFQCSSDQSSSTRVCVLRAVESDVVNDSYGFPFSFVEIFLEACPELPMRRDAISIADWPVRPHGVALSLGRHEEPHHAC